MDVTGQPIGPILKGLADQDGLDCLPLKMGPLGYPETSLTTNIRCVKSQKRVNLELITVERTIVQYTKNKGNKIYYWCRKLESDMFIAITDSEFSL